MGGGEEKEKGGRRLGFQPCRAGPGGARLTRCKGCCDGAGELRTRRGQPHLLVAAGPLEVLGHAAGGRPVGGEGKDELQGRWEEGGRGEETGQSGVRRKWGRVPGGNGQKAGSERRFVVGWRSIEG